MQSITGWQTHLSCLTLHVFISKILSSPYHVFLEVFKKLEMNQLSFEWRSLEEKLENYSIIYYFVVSLFIALVSKISYIFFFYSGLHSTQIPLKISGKSFFNIVWHIQFSRLPLYVVSKQKLATNLIFKIKERTHT